MDLQTFVKTLPAANFALPNKRSEFAAKGLHVPDDGSVEAYFYPEVGESYRCTKSFDLEDFIDFTHIEEGDVLYLERKTPKCLSYSIR